MGRTKAAHGDPAAVPAPEELGLDEVDEASAASMDASDPPAFGGVTGVGDAGGNGRRQRIAERAHELWRAAGSPEGQALDFWLAAEREIEGAAGQDAPGKGA